MKKYGWKIQSRQFPKHKMRGGAICIICHPPTKARRALEKKNWKVFNLV